MCLEEMYCKDKIIPSRSVSSDQYFLDWSRLDHSYIYHPHPYPHPLTEAITRQIKDFL